MNIIGHKDIIKNLISISKFKDIPPLLFYGQFGIGKSTTALYFCSLCNPKSEEKIYKLNHPDIIFISVGELKPYGPRPDNFDNLKNISIEQIRNLKIELQKPPIYAKRRIVIIMDADMLTIEAQNSLLKILEEHQNKTTFILITSNYLKILPTILSRTLKISFKSLSFEEFLSYEYNWNYDIKLIYEISEGSIGIAKELNNYPINDWLNTLNEVKSVKNVLEILKTIQDSKDFMNFLRVFRFFYKKKYIESSNEIYYKILKHSLEIEDSIKRYASIEASLISLFGGVINGKV
jgi:replication-associated recombination protein RarA